MKQIILPDGRELCYELIRKRVKNINFRIKEEGVVMVSASPKVPINYIEQCLAKRADFFFGAFEKIRARKAAQTKSTETSAEYSQETLALKTFKILSEPQRPSALKPCARS